MAYFFETLDQWIADVDAYINELSKHTFVKDGVAQEQLIGIDGKPTEDKSLFGSRNSIFKNFKFNYSIYIRENDRHDIDKFQQENSYQYLWRDNHFDNAIAHFNTIHNTLVEADKEIIAMKAEYESEDADKAAIDDWAQDKVEEMLRLVLLLTKIFEKAQYAGNAGIMTDMMMSYTMKGRAFLDDPEWQDVKGLKKIEEMRGIIAHVTDVIENNLKCKSIKDFQTL
ncbi:MAG: hypothetical protein IKI57_07335 [Clostridia bacterium]|nr:hypothetical protein [Clostridia bacterium]